MKGKRGICAANVSIIASCIALLFAAAFFSCAGEAGHFAIEEPPDDLPAASGAKGPPLFVPSLVVPSPQETAFNGHPKPLSFSYSGDDTPQVIYYPSLWALEDEKGGSHIAPTRVGTYYVLVRCRDEEAHAEYRIVKCPVAIFAEERQEAIYDGNPKRVRSEAEPPVPLTYSYYPNPELMEAAIKSVKEMPPGRNSTQALSQMFQGYRRVERAPTEQGTYYVWVFYPGDDNYLPAETRITFTILPAVTAPPQRR